MKSKYRGMTVGLAAASAIWSGAAQAEGRTDGGAFLSLSFGGGEAKFGLGLELRQAWASSFNRDVGFAGGVARLGWRGFSSPYLHVAAQGGSLLGEASVAGEAALGYQWGPDRGLQTLLGADVSGEGLSAHSDFDVLRRSGTLGLGVRVREFPVFRQRATATPGRPLRARNGRANAPGVVLGNPTEMAEGLPSPLRGALADQWLQRARGEWASVPAFMQLAQQLEIAGAPAALVQRALVAAEDEARHAFLSAGILARLLGTVVVLEPVSMHTRVPAFGLDAVVRLAVESWLDGCLGEGVAAAVATVEAQGARDLLIGQTQSVIAEEEARHGDLAWDVLDWCMSAGGDAVARTLTELSGSMPAAPSGESVGDELAAYGIASTQRQQNVVLEVREVAQRRLHSLI